MDHAREEVASELRLVDATDYIAFIRTEQFANIGNLVSSSTEMFFRPGTVLFGASADANLVWGGTPSVSLDMEFRHLGVNVYFRLILEEQQAGIEIDFVSFDKANGQVNWMSAPEGRPTDTIYASYLAEDKDRAKVARLFEISPAEVADAVAFEQSLAH